MLLKLNTICIGRSDGIDFVSDIYMPVFQSIKLGLDCPLRFAIDQTITILKKSLSVLLNVCLIIQGEIYGII